MKRVKDHKFLYRRGDAFYFRRAVPPERRNAFGGKREVVVSFGDVDLRRARHLLGSCIVEFDRLASTQEPRGHPPEGLSGSAHVPTPDEIASGVRAWFAEGTDRIAAGVSSQDPPDGRLKDLQCLTEDVRRAVANGGSQLTTAWIAAHLAEALGWKIRPGSAEERSLLRFVARGQVELAHRERQEIAFEPITVSDQSFGAEDVAAAKLDIAKRLQRAPLMVLFRGYVAEARLKPATSKAWGRQFGRLIDFLGQ